MAYTLAEANKLSNDVVKVGVIETIIKESPILSRLPFDTVLGTGLTYNRENAMATAAYFSVGDNWTESTPTFTQVTAALKILGGDADVDNFIAKTRSNIQDVVAVTVEAKAKAVAHQFEDTFIYGNATSTPTEFDGLHQLIPSGQQIHQGSGTTPAALSLANMDALLDLVRPGFPDLLVMTRRTRRLLSQYIRSTSSPFLITYDEFGKAVFSYNGVPIAVSDFAVDTETLASGAFAAKTGGASSSVFALKLDPNVGLAGIEGTNGIQVDPIGQLESKDASRWRLKWYVALALYGTIGVAKIDGISSGAVVA